MKPEAVSLMRRRPHQRCAELNRRRREARRHGGTDSFTERAPPNGGDASKATRAARDWMNELVFAIGSRSARGERPEAGSITRRRRVMDAPRRVAVARERCDKGVL